MTRPGWTIAGALPRGSMDLPNAREGAEVALTGVHSDPTLLARVIDAIETEQFFPALRDFINAAVAIDNCVALVFATDKPPLILHQWSPQEPNYFQMLYCQGAYVLDPFYRICAENSGGGTFLLDEIAPDSFNESDFYQTYYQKVQMIDEIGLLFPVDGKRMIHLSLGRRMKSEYFTAADAARIRHIEPLLESLLKRHARTKLDQWTAGHPAPGDPVAHSATHLANRWLAPYNVTSREAEIAAMVLRGHSNTSIGLTLNISIETVKVHRRNLYSKVRISSQAELFMLFINHILETGDSTLQAMH
ncbi:helix-turn-helix transcriptional regulator [Sinorhizobium sp. BG8]|uniref:helix-turn-helix transcriptional regulator n=1 Tax=Sinorhizobium sp. BG8 TaxID=2613773 RepID=UPI00193D70D4|nr:helix-turn-helix transcriptional regulator [Sinorhizobium sp. BG8]QRM57670.1 helix-turn-helix transcriptional regulator [Sinorhizobium sp. BG8]